MPKSSPPSELGPAASPQATYALEQLLAIAGEQLGEEISPRTVRLYATEGLIDRPGREGRRALYGQRHLLQLLLVRSLARRGLSLSAIAPLVAADNDELEQRLAQLDDTSSDATPDSAIWPGADDGSANRQSLCASEADSDHIVCSDADELPNQALLYLQAIQAPQSEQKRINPQLLSMLGAPPGKQAAAAFSRRLQRASSRWHRFSLARGVELHLSESASIPPAGPQREAWLQRLFDRLREQLDEQS